MKGGLLRNCVSPVSRSRKRGHLDSRLWINFIFKRPNEASTADYANQQALTSFLRSIYRKSTTPSIRQARKFVSRYDLKSTKSSIELDEAESKIVVRAPDDFTRRSVVEVLECKNSCARPGASQRLGSRRAAASLPGRRLFKRSVYEQGIPMEKARRDRQADQECQVARSNRSHPR